MRIRDSKKKTMMVQMECLVPLLLIFHHILHICGLKIGAFNAQVFGEMKAKNSRVLGLIAQIAARYDILLLQEIRDVKGTAIYTLLNRIEKDYNVKFDLVISERLGRSDSKEQYAFLFRGYKGIRVIHSYHFYDWDESTGADIFEREPFIVRFHATNSEVPDFTLVGLHVRPDKALQELKALSKVFDDVSQKLSTRNIMMLGDFNADCTYMPKKAWSEVDVRHNSEFWWPIGDDKDTTVSPSTHCAYDRFMITGKSLIKAVLPGSVGIFDFQKAFHLTLEQAREVSDHYPIELQLREKVNVDGTKISHESRSEGVSTDGSNWFMSLILHLLNAWQGLADRFHTEL